MTPTVLYVEDNPANVRLVARILTLRPAIRLLSAGLALAGLELARQHQPALILLDLHLPDLSGVEMLSRLRRDPTTEHIAVVVVSGDAASGQDQRLVDLGVAGCLAKPYEMGSLLELVDLHCVVESDQATTPMGAPETEVPQDSILDMSIIASFHRLAERGGLAKVSEMIGLFLAETTAQLVDLDAAAAGAHVDELREVIHRLQGSSGCYGAQRMAGRCTELRALLDAGRLSEVMPVLRQVKFEFAEARQALLAIFPRVKHESPGK